MSNPATRLITLIMLLQRQPNQKAAGLARELGISVRSLHRYFAMLEEMGIPVYAERGPYGGFSLVRGYKMPPLALTPEEAVAVTLGTGLVAETWGTLYQEAATGALAKLDRLLPEEQRGEAAWARRSLVTLGLRNPGLDSQAPLVEKLRRAIRELRRVEMVYTSASQPQPSRRRLNPYVLALRWGWWYVAGFCHVHGEVRTFRVDRIQEVVLLGETFQIPPGFNGREFFEKDFHGQPQVTATLRFASEAAHLARINHLDYESLSEQEDGSVQVRFSAPDLQWAAASILMYGPLVTVLAPPELCLLVAGMARRVAALYPGLEGTDG